MIYATTQQNFNPLQKTKKTSQSISTVNKVSKKHIGLDIGSPPLVLNHRKRKLTQFSKWEFLKSIKQVCSFIGPAHLLKAL